MVLFRSYNSSKFHILCVKVSVSAGDTDCGTNFIVFAMAVVYLGMKLNKNYVAFLNKFGAGYDSKDK